MNKWIERNQIVSDMCYGIAGGSMPWGIGISPGSWRGLGGSMPGTSPGSGVSGAGSRIRAWTGRCGRTLPPWLITGGSTRRGVRPCWEAETCTELLTRTLPWWICGLERGGGSFGPSMVGRPLESDRPQRRPQAGAVAPGPQAQPGGGHGCTDADRFRRTG